MESDLYCNTVDASGNGCGTAAWASAFNFGIRSGKRHWIGGFCKVCPDIRDDYFSYFGRELCAIAGGISFVGLMVPHIARFLVGTDYRKILPVSLLSGSLLMVLADVSARMLNAPYDTPVGALVSVLGVPFFLALTYQKRKRRWK